MSHPIIHINTADGHRPCYRDLFVRLFDGTPSTGSIRGRRFWRLLRAPTVFFATIDDDYTGFIAVAFLRAIQRKPTTGLFLRPLQCFRTERPIIYPMKRRVFRWLRMLPRLRLLSIIPHEVRPELREITHDWIHDPQMWDLWVEGPPSLPETELSHRVNDLRKGRKILIFIGKANRIKGFEELCQMASKEVERCLIVVAGKVDEAYQRSADELCSLGMIVEDRFVTDEEILSLYGVADKAWCWYAPDYDQASGVFGRAIQTGVNPVFRQNSVIAKIWETQLSPALAQDEHATEHFLRECVLRSTRVATSALQ